MVGSTKKGITLFVRSTGEKSIKAIAKNLQKVAKNSRSVKRNFTGLRNVFLGVFAARGIRSVVRMADSIQLLGDRINAFTGDTEEGAEALDLLFDAANRTNVEVDTLADGFNRIALATQELGLSTKDMIAFTTTLQNAFRIQGATASESRGAIIQLTQGLASGALRGQELRSVLEASAVAGSVLADAVGITRGQLIKFGETGALTSEVVLKAFSERALELDERAGKLGTTFGQTLTKALNEFKRGLNEVNKDLELNKIFEKSVLQVTIAIKDLIKVTSESGAFKTAIKNVGDFFENLADVANEVSGNKSPAEKLRDQIDQIDLAIQRAAILSKSSAQRTSGDDFLTKALKSIFPEGIGGESTFESVRKKTEVRLDGLRATRIRLQKELDDLAGISTPDGGANKKDPIFELLKNFSNNKFEGLLNKGLLTLGKLNLLFRTGKIDTDKYNEALIKLQKLDLGKQYADGKLDVFEYNEAIEELSDRLAILQNRLDPLQAGAKAALRSIATFGEETAKAVENSFSTLEDQLFQFTKTGNFLFNDFAQSVLDDISRILIRTQLIKPLLGSITGGFSGGGLSQGQIDGRAAEGSFQFPQGNAKGGVFSNGDIQAFAKGGVVNAPTFFPTRSGSGLMGEAGAEAIIPLERVSGGDLGVKAIPGQTIVNVNNQAGAEIEIEESADGNTKLLDITITKAVKNGINQGRFDKAFSSSFGVNRKGSR